jgi:hypothetical protein
MNDCGPGSVEAGEQLLEGPQGPGLSVHRKGLAQRIPDSGVDGRRRDLHEPFLRAIDHGFPFGVKRIHNRPNEAPVQRLQPLHR